jgi:hypothetical protein
MKSPTAALIWDIWFRHRTLFGWLGGITLVTSVVNLFVRLWGPSGLRLAAVQQPSGAGAMALGMFNWHAVGGAFMLALVIFSYEEFNSDLSSRGFPHRLFTLPVPTAQLVALPMLLGVAAIEAVYWASSPMHDGGVLGAVLFGAFVPVFQTVLWTLGRLGPLRLVVLGAIIVVFMAAALEPAAPGALFSQRAIMLLASGVGIGMGFVAWVCVSGQRSGGRQAEWLHSLVGKAVFVLSAVAGPAMVYRIWTRGFARPSLLAVAQLTIIGWSGISLLRSLQHLGERWPGRRRDFRSAASAQFWFEWKRGGHVLPALVAALLGLVMVPSSWNNRADASSTLYILTAVLLMPLLFAALVGKAFSKVDFWSGDVAMPGSAAVRPMTASEMVAVKVRVAALAAGLSWGLVALFLIVWLSFWANTTILSRISLAAATTFDISTGAECAVVVLVLASLTVLTWKLMVAGLWLGLAGSRLVFALTSLPYVILPFFAMAFVISFFQRQQTTLQWIQSGLQHWTPTLEWVAAAGLIAKLAMMVYTIRRMTRAHVLQYTAFWMTGVACLWTTVLLITGALNKVHAPVPPGLKPLLIMSAILMVPIGRFEIAAFSLSRNRHR